MKYFLPAILLLTGGTHSSTFAQQLPEILTTSQYKIGIYADFNEFLNNKPSITTDFQIVPLSGEKKIEKGEGDFKLVMFDSAYRRRDVKKFWGASDGERLYVNELMYGTYFRFKQIHGTGRYCYFKGSRPDNGGVAAATAAGGAVGGALAAVAMSYDVAYILNVNNGKFYQLTPHLLGVILESDRELSDRYEVEKRSRNDDLMLSYIKEYNARHVDEAFIDRPMSFDVVLFRLDKRQNDKSFVVHTADTLSFKMSMNRLHTFVSRKNMLTVCAESRCEEIPLDKKHITYIECLWRPNATAPEFRKVERKVGEFYSKKLQ